MNGVRIFLAIETLIWVPYGLFCFLSPGALAEVAGVAAKSVTGTTELRAMYGGLQVAIGLATLAGAVSPALARDALRLLLVLTAGIGGARALGVVLDGGLSVYTASGLAFELVTAGVAAVLLRRASDGARPSRGI